MSKLELNRTLGIFYGSIRATGATMAGAINRRFKSIRKWLSEEPERSRVNQLSLPKLESPSIEELIYGYITFSLAQSKSLVRKQLRLHGRSPELSAVLEDVGNKYLDLSDAVTEAVPQRPQRQPNEIAATFSSERWPSWHQQVNHSFSDCLQAEYKIDLSAQASLPEESGAPDHRPSVDSRP